MMMIRSASLRIVLEECGDRAVCQQVHYCRNLGFVSINVPCECCLGNAAFDITPSISVAQRNLTLCDLISSDMHAAYSLLIIRPVTSGYRTPLSLCVESNH